MPVILTHNLPLFHIFANLHVLALSQKHGDDQILHDFMTTYEICIRVNNFIDYNTYSGMRDAQVRANDWDEHTRQSESKNDYMACQHLRHPKQ